MTLDRNSALDRARLSLEGLSLGDAFGQLQFALYPHFSPSSELPAGPWRWTDDTHMALSVVETLAAYGRIEQDVLVSAFAGRFRGDPNRGYGQGAARLLAAVANGADWRVVAPQLFGGGSYGNGAAMRASPIGAYYSGDPTRAASEARLSAVVTHAHPEGQAGAMAVAVAASLASIAGGPCADDFIGDIAALVPEGQVQDLLRKAMSIPRDRLNEAIRELGTGYKISAQDTVPFCIWVAAHHSNDYELALWTTAAGLGDCDTTCAIVGGIVALSAQELPSKWLSRREPLPELG
jgi:ADP-ribosylglycohydrolase